jgi:putative phosphoesterase
LLTKKGLMMKIGILSDTHDQLERTSEAVSALIRAGAELLIHCGDITEPAIVLECAGLPTTYVFGNNDHDHDKLRRTILGVGGVCLGKGGTIELEGRTIAVTHGDSNREISRLADANPDYFLSGHTHCADDERRGSTRWINPGALHRAKPWSVAVLDLATDHLEFLTVGNRR